MKLSPKAGAATLVLWAASLCPADEVAYTAYYYWDEVENTVATTSFSMAKTLWRKTMLMLDIELDQVTAPALDVDATSGASRPRRQATREFRKSRGQIIAGAEQALGGSTRVAGSYYFSQEIDYRSQAVVGTLTQELFQKNLTLSLRGQYTLDSVGEILLDGSLVNRLKETHQGAFTATQLLSRTTILRLGGDGYRYQGFLSDPYSNDAHPSERWRQSAWTEVSQYLTGLEGSLILDYRYYWDDWDIESHTAQLRLNKYLTRDLIFSPWYRYYIQAAASFYGMPANEELHSTDYKLSAFESNTMGAEVTWYLRSLGRRRPGLAFLANSSVSTMYFRYFNNAQEGQFTCNVVQTRINFSY